MVCESISNSFSEFNMINATIIEQTNLMIDKIIYKVQTKPEPYMAPMLYERASGD